MLAWLHISQMSASHMMELQKGAPASRCGSFIAGESISDSESCKCGSLACWRFCINGAAEGSEQAFCTVGKGLSQWRRVALGRRHLLISGGNCSAIFLSLMGVNTFPKYQAGVISSDWTLVLRGHMWRTRCCCQQRQVSGWEMSAPSSVYSAPLRPGQNICPRSWT